MKAMVFAAGLGTRLKPFTQEHPKALVPVGGVPMLQRVIEKLIIAGVDEIVVNVHHFASQITDFLAAKDNFGVKIHISDESDKLLDTGGGILKARPWLDGNESFIVHNADILTDFDIHPMWVAHDRNNADATLLTDHRKSSRYLLFDDKSKLQGWQNIQTAEVKPAGLNIEGLHPLAFGGVHLLSPSIFSQLEKYANVGDKFSITDFYIDSCRKLHIQGHVPQAKYMWHDVGKPESLSMAEAAVANA